jgi:hypothetical protein
MPAVKAYARRYATQVNLSTLRSPLDESRYYTLTLHEQECSRCLNYILVILHRRVEP